MNNKSTFLDGDSSAKSSFQSSGAADESDVYEIIYGTFARNPGVFWPERYGEAA
jgi:hypothetical protein